MLFCLQAQSLAVYIDGGTVMVQSGDVVADQNDDIRTGYDFRFSYYPNYDYSFEGDGPFGKYYINNNSHPSFYGYMSTVYEQSGTQVNIAAYYPIIPTAINTTSWVIWHFDFSSAGTAFNTIDQLQVKMRSNVANNVGATIAWQVSTDGQSWDDIFSLSANQFNAAFWDITEQVQGSSEYFIKATLFSIKNPNDAALFKNSDFGFDNEVWLVPEPGTMFLLAAGLAGVLIRKKRLDH
jgi:hypothetical protein